MLHFCPHHGEKYIHNHCDRTCNNFFHVCDECKKK